MRLQVRGLFMAVVSGVGIVVNVLDAIDDGFSIWNGIGIACFLVMLGVGVMYIRAET